MVLSPLSLLQRCLCSMKAELAKADVRPDQVVAMEEELADATALTSALSAKLAGKDAEVGGRQGDGMWIAAISAHGLACS